MSLFDLTGRTALVTGSGRGIGYALAKGLGIGDIEQEWGTPDIVVNNAGIQGRAPIAQYTLENRNDLGATKFDDRLPGQPAGGRRHDPSRKRKDHQRRVCAEPAGPDPDSPRYIETKGGIVVLTKGLWSDLGPLKIQANALAPGYFETELTQARLKDDQFTRWVTTRTPPAAWGKVGDLVGGLVFLAPPASDFVNGQVLYVDGGMTAVV